MTHSQKIAERQTRNASPNRTDTQNVAPTYSVTLSMPSHYLLFRQNTVFLPVSRVHAEFQPKPATSDSQ
jgi:hypothetical protein